MGAPAQRPPQPGRGRSSTSTTAGAGRRPVTRQRYLVRRLAVVLLLAAVSVAAIKGVLTLTENDAAGQGPPNTAGTSIATGSAGSTTVSPSTASTVAAPPATDTPAADAERSGPPTADEPARILVVGDSDAGAFAPYLQRLLDETGVVDITLDYKTSSGLARPDFYDWPAELQRALAEDDPDIVVATFGGNDSQGLTAPCPGGAGSCSPDFVVGDPSSNEEEWTAEYVQRAGAIMEMVLDSGATLIWVGIPNDDNPEVTADLAVQDQAVRQAADGRDGVVFVDTWKRFAGRSGGYAQLVVDPRDGQAKNIRQSDGFHLNVDGAEILAIDIATQVENVLKDMGAEL